jgi:hypothetical protein
MRQAPNAAGRRKEIAGSTSELPETAAVREALVHRAQVLDTFYVPTRYPNSHGRRLWRVAEQEGIGAYRRDDARSADA